GGHPSTSSLNVSLHYRRSTQAVCSPRPPWFTILQGLWNGSPCTPLSIPPLPARARMRFESRIFWLSKDADESAQYQDAFALDAETGRAAIADGVSSAIFSGPWARLLTLGAVADPPPLEDGGAFQAWLAEKRAAWANGIDASKLTWYQRPKMVDGAMTT